MRLVLRNLKVLILALAFLLLIGGLGLRTIDGPQGCNNDPEIRRDAERIQCYHIAALTEAYLCTPGQLCLSAIGICDRIWTQFGSSIDPVTGSDTRRKAELVSNTCYHDVAKITRSNATCDYITQRDNLGTQLFGYDVTREACHDQVGRLSLLAPENYYQNNPNNICSIVYILPFFVLGTILIQRP